MKLLRIGKKNYEKPAILSKDGKIIDISSCINDFNPDYLNFETISKLQSIDYLHYQNFLQARELVLVLQTQENLLP